MDERSRGQLGPRSPQQSRPPRLVWLCHGLLVSPFVSSCSILCSCSPEPCKNQPQSRKHSVSKSLKHLFHPGSKFLKTLKR